jgi:hypothetical protein
MKSIAKYTLVAALGLCGAASRSEVAAAADITFAVIDGHEYDLPVNYKDFFAFVQYGQFNSTSQFFDARGNLNGAPRQNLAVGLSKFVYFTTIDALPDVGFAIEAILPEIYLGTRDAKERFGFGDTLWGAATWIKPTPNSTLGIQTFLQAPIGGDYFSNHFFANYTSILFDVQGKDFSLTGDVGGVFRSEQNAPGAASVNPGTTFHTNLRLGYKLNMPTLPVEPFLALDYQYNTAARLASTNAIISNSRNQDLALGAGLSFFFDPKQNLSIRYSRSVYAENASPTNAVYLRYLYIP